MTKGNSTSKGLIVGTFFTLLLMLSLAGAAMASVSTSNISPTH